MDGRTLNVTQLSQNQSEARLYPRHNRYAGCFSFASRLLNLGGAKNRILG